MDEGLEDWKLAGLKKVGELEEGIGDGEQEESSEKVGTDINEKVED